jgi:hypothetical protein
MSYHIVVARYNEPVDWLRREMKHCIIYNKGERLQLENEIALPNVGRESGTYLQYIIENYNALPDAVVFTQARIGDHLGCEDDNYCVDYLVNIKNEALTYGKSSPDVVHDESNPYRNPCWDSEWNYENGSFFLNDNYYEDIHMTFIDWFQKHIQKEYPSPISIYRSAIFAVKKEYILQHPKQYYCDLLRTCNHHINPVEGHFFERSWYYIFASS